MYSRRIAAVAAVGSLLWLLACAGPAERERSWEAMGTTAETLVYTRTERDAESALEEIVRKIAAAAETLDPGSAQGDVGRLNAGAADGFVELRQVDAFACLKLALDYARESQGAYDPTGGALRSLWATRLAAADPPRPAEIDAALARVGWEKVVVEPEALAARFLVPGLRLDLGPVAHGCAVDWAVRTFAHPGSLGGKVGLGGAWRAWQAPPGEEAWTLGLADPRDARRGLIELRLADRAAAVCGQPAPDDASTAETLSAVPILDPRSGLPAATDLLAVVTTADSAADAAALCRAILVSGSLAGPEVFRKMRRAEAFLLVRADEGPPFAVASASLRGRMRLSAELEAETGGDVRYLLPPKSF